MVNPDFQTAVDKFDLVGWTTDYAKLVHETRKSARFDCPFCDSRRTLSVGKEKKIVKCFRCSGAGHPDWSGVASAVTWITLLKHCSKYDAIKIILAGTGIIARPEFIAPDTDYSIPKDAMKIAESCDQDHPCRLFLRSRGMDHLSNRLFVCVTGKYKGRILLPIYWMKEYLGFEAKSYTKQTPKSLSVCQPDSLYMCSCWNTSMPQVVITESYLDTETVGVNSISLLGSDMGEDRFARLLGLRKLGVKTLIWFLDGDALAKQLKLTFKWTSIYFENKVVDCPPKDDPNSLGTSKCWELINKARTIENEFDICV